MLQGMDMPNPMCRHVPDLCNLPEPRMICALRGWTPRGHVSTEPARSPYRRGLRYREEIQRVAQFGEQEIITVDYLERLPGLREFSVTDQYQLFVPGNFTAWKASSTPQCIFPGHPPGCDRDPPKPVIASGDTEMLASGDEDNPWVQSWRESAVNLEWVLMDSIEKKPIVFASDDYPAMMMMFGVTGLITQLLQEGVVTDLRQHLGRGYTSNLDQIFAEKPEALAYMMNPQGQMQALARFHFLESNSTAVLLDVNADKPKDATGDGPEEKPEGEGEPMPEPECDHGSDAEHC